MNILESTDQIRRNWKIYWVVALLYNLATGAYIFFDATSPLSYAMRFAVYLGSVGIAVAMYHCAYRKTGTKLLTFFMVCSFISLICFPFTVVKELLNKSELQLWDIFELVTETLLIVWSLKASLPLRRLNRAMRKKAQESPAT